MKMNELTKAVLSIFGLLIGLCVRLHRYSRLGFSRETHKIFAVGDYDE